MSAILPIEEDPRFRISTATDGQTEFAVPFPFQANADIVVLKIADGVETVLEEAEDYTLTGAGLEAGGTVTLLQPAEAGWQIVRSGKVVLDRLSSIVRGGKYDSKATDDDLDRIIIALQEVQRDLARAFMVKLGGAGGVVVPGSAGHMAIFDADGNIVGGDDPSVVAGRSAYEEAVANGFVGNEAAWLASLESTVPGPQGDSAYAVAVAEGFVGDEAAWLATLESTVPGPQGDSAYDVAVAEGFVGDETAWLATLESTVPGPVGPAGNDGLMNSVAAGTGIDIDDTDPSNPVVSVETNLAEWNTVNPSTDGKSLVAAANYAAMLTLLGFSTDGSSLVSAANYAAMRTLLGLVIGTDVQAADSDLTSIAALTTTSYGRAFLTLANQAATMALLSAGTTSASGILELATSAEFRTGTDTARALGVAETWAGAAYVALTDAATIATDFSTFLSLASCALGGNRTMGNPSNEKVGQFFVFKFTAVTSTRTLTLHADYVLGVGVEAGPYSITTSETLLVCGFVDATSVLRVTSVIRF